MRMNKNTLRLGLTMAACAALAGCSGHGKYTQEQKNRAEAALAAIKSGTEWDMAQQAFLGGALEKALKKVDQSLAINQSVAKSHSLRGRILFEMGELDRAMDSFERAEAIDPNFIDAHYYQGIVYERIMEHEEALAKFKTCVEIDNTNPQYAIAAAEVMIDMDRPDQAKEFLLSLGRTFEHNAGVAQTLGHIAMMQNDDAAAADHFSRARLLAPDDEAIFEDLIRAQVATGQYAEAEYNLAQLLAESENADRRDLKHMRARCLVEVDRVVEARMALMELTEGAEGAADIDAWVALGDVAYRLHDYNHVRRTAQRIQAMAPNRAEGYMLEAMWHYQNGSFEKALAACNTAAKAAPNNADVHLFSAVTNFKMARFDDARKSLAQAQTIAPENGAVAAMLAVIDGDSPADTFVIVDEPTED